MLSNHNYIGAATIATSLVWTLCSRINSNLIEGISRNNDLYNSRFEVSDARLVIARRCINNSLFILERSLVEKPLLNAANITYDDHDAYEKFRNDLGFGNPRYISYVLDFILKNTHTKAYKSLLPSEREEILIINLSGFCKRISERIKEMLLKLNILMKEHKESLDFDNNLKNDLKDPRFPSYTPETRNQLIDKIRPQLLDLNVVIQNNVEELYTCIQDTIPILKMLQSIFNRNVNINYYEDPSYKQGIMSIEHLKLYTSNFIARSPTQYRKDSRNIKLDSLGYGAQAISCLTAIKTNNPLYLLLNLVPLTFLSYDIGRNYRNLEKGNREINLYSEPFDPPNIEKLYTGNNNRIDDVLWKLSSKNAGSMQFVITMPW